MNPGTAVIVNLLGGVALLLWGVRMVRTGVTRAYGDRERSTSHRATLGELVVFSAQRDPRLKALDETFAATLMGRFNPETPLCSSAP